MRTRPTLLALAAGLALSLPAGAAAPRASLQIVSSPLSGGIYTHAVNDRGQVVGDADDGSGYRGFVWSAADGLQLLTATGVPSEARGINNHGQVTGNFVTDTFVLVREAFVWSRETGLVPLGQGWSAGLDINDHGLVVGHSLDDTGRRVATTWLGGVRQTTSIRGDLFGVNDHGQAVGGPLFDVTPGQAFQWQSGQPVRVLGHLGSTSMATAINVHGDIVGRSNLADGRHLAVLWQGGGPRSLGHLGWGRSEAFGINDATQVVGTSQLADGSPRAMLWTAGGGMSNLATLTGSGFVPFEARDINAYAQVAGTGRGTASGGQDRPYLLTLHPDWQGGDGAWNDSTGQRWNWAGTGTAAARVGAMHDVVIDPGRSATVTGAAEGRARSLMLGGTAGTVVTLRLDHGTTTLGDGDPVISRGSEIRTGGVLAGSGRLVVDESLSVRAGGRIEVGAGEAMQIDAELLNNSGRVRVFGNAGSVARLETSGLRYHFTNDSSGEVLVQHGELLLSGGLQNFGRVTLHGGSRLLAADTVLNHAGGQIAMSFGESLVEGVIDNRGLLVVGNGAVLSLHGLLTHRGELRVSTGGRANVFGDVHFLSGGSLTGEGDIRFEGGLIVDGGPTMATLGVAPRTLLAGGAFTWAGSAAGLAAGDRVDLFDWLGGVEGSFGALTLPALADGLLWDSSDLYAGGTLAVVAVPEPGTVALWLAGLAALGLRRRRAARTSRTVAAGAALAGALLLPAAPALAAGGFAWNAESGLLPSEVSGGMALVDTSPAHDPVLAGGLLTLRTDANAEMLLYRHTGAALAWDGALQIDARLMLGPGSSANPGPGSPRSHASIVFVDAAGNGNALFFAPDRVFLLGPGDVLGAEAAIAADGDFHDWRIAVTGPGAGSAVQVFFDGTPVLAGALFGGSPFVTGGALSFGDGTLGAQGSSQWSSFAYTVSAVPEPASLLLAALGLPALLAWRRRHAAA